MLVGTMVSLRGGLERIVALEILDYSLMGAEIGRMGLDEYLFHE